MKRSHLFDGNLKILKLSFVVIIIAVPMLLATEDIENTKVVLEKWVETQKVISQEKRDFEIAKEMLNQRVELVQREIDNLRDKIAEAEKSIDEADKKRAEMLKENDKLKQASDSLDSDLASLESRTKTLITQLPQPIVEKIKPLSQVLPQSPEKAKEAKLTTSQRFQNVIGILNEVDKFNRDITVTSEVRELEDGSSVEVTALYVGISQAYFANANGTIAGVGSSTADGWIWKTDKSSAQTIYDAISIMKNEKQPSFVQVPVDIK